MADLVLGRKKVGFLVTHLGQLKLFAPLVKEISLVNDISLFCLSSKLPHDQFLQVRSFFSKLQPFVNKLDILEINSYELLVSSPENEVPNDFIVEYLDEELFLFLENNSEHKIFYLQHSHDLVSTFPSKWTFKQMMKIEGFLTFSDFWKQEAVNAYAQSFNLNIEDKELLEQKFYSVGFPELDQITEYSREKILNKYNLPADAKKIIFFDPMGDASHVGNAYYAYFFKLNGTVIKRTKIFFKQLAYDLFNNPKKIHIILIMIFKLFLTSKKGLNYERLYLDLRNYCDEKGYLLVVKSRQKNNDADFIKEHADYYSYDLDYYPFTLLELLYISDIYIGFNSTSTIEAICCNCLAVQINICPSELHYNSSYGGGIYKYLASQLSQDLSWNNYKELIKVMKFDDNFSVLTQFLENKANTNKQKKEYINNFVFKDDGKSSKRVLEIINS